MDNHLLTEVEHTLCGLYGICGLLKDIDSVRACYTTPITRYNTLDELDPIFHFAKPLTDLVMQLEYVDRALFSIRNDLVRPSTRKWNGIQARDIQRILDKQNYIPAFLKKINQILRKFPSQIEKEDFSSLQEKMGHLQEHAEILYTLLPEISVLEEPTK